MALQSKIDAGKSVDSRRRMGQFATPSSLAAAIVRETLKYLSGKKRFNVLEPSMGTGAFLSALFSEAGGRVGRVCGCELDDDFHRAALSVWETGNVEIMHGDFLAIPPSDVFDLVVANPPYVRHHLLTQGRKRNLQTQVHDQLGIGISGLAGLYCYFLLLSLRWMKKGAVAAWLIPSEWMSVNYGKAIRGFLTQNVTLMRIHKFDADDVRFDDALVSSCVVWFRNCPSGSEPVVLTYGPDISRPRSTRKYAVSELASCDKWPPADVRPKADEPKLSDLFDIRRGIATGDNKFFVMTEAEAASKGIPSKFLKPILPSPRNLKVERVESDSNGVPANVERRFLLDCTGWDMAALPREVRTYLETGLTTTSKKNLCASRTVWYYQEQRRPSPVLCSYMGRSCRRGTSPVRFILNESHAIATNSFLMLYPKGELESLLASDPGKRFDLWKLLLKIPAENIVGEGRSYGGGLQKIEPRELGRVRCHKVFEWLAHSAKDAHIDDNATGAFQMRLFDD